MALNDDENYDATTQNQLSATQNTIDTVPGTSGMLSGTNYIKRCVGVSTLNVNAYHSITNVIITPTMLPRVKR